MSKKNRNDDKYNIKNTDDFDMFLSCSTTDLTGLMPTPPRSEAELESYKAVYQFQPTESDDLDKK